MRAVADSRSGRSEGCHECAEFDPGGGGGYALAVPGLSFTK